MDLLYIVGDGRSEHDNFDLRCSLRSIAKYGKGIDRVFVSGYCPEWLSDNIICLPHESRYEMLPGINMNKKSINIMDSVVYAVKNSDIGDEFLVSMDDHFYVRKVDFNNYPIYCRNYKNRPFKNHLPGPDDKCDSAYLKHLRHTRRFLEEHELSIYNFSLHRNFHLWKEDVIACSSMIDEIIEQADENPHGVECFDLFLNYRYTQQPFEFEIIEDVKLNGPGEWWKTDPRQTEVFSTVDFNKGLGLYNLLSDLYPKKCKYEKEIVEEPENE